MSCAVISRMMKSVTRAAQALRELGYRPGTDNFETHAHEGLNRCFVRISTIDITGADAVRTVALYDAHESTRYGLFAILSGTDVITCWVRNTQGGSTECKLESEFNTLSSAYFPR
jgi:hypothetical protein